MSSINRELSPPHLKSSLPAVDIGSFFAAVNDALNLHLKTNKWPPGTQPVFVHDFPKERLAKADDPFDIITFHVGGSEMAPSSNDGSRVPRGPVIREEIPSKRLPGYNTSVMAWKEEAAVVFCIWSKSNRRADDMVNWFHRFMMKYAFMYQFFKARGVDRFEFVKRGQDETDRSENQEVYKRTLVYKIRIEYLDTSLNKVIDNVSVNLGISSLQTDEIELK